MPPCLAGATAAHPPCKRVVPGSNPGRGSRSTASASRPSRTCSSTGRAAGLHPVGCRFDSCRAHCVTWSTATLVGVPATVQAVPQRGSEAEALPVMGLYVAETGNPKALTRQHGECSRGYARRRPAKGDALVLRRRSGSLRVVVPSSARSAGRRTARSPQSRFAGTITHFGLWRSLVARFVRDEEVAGSSPVSPTTRRSSRAA